jgi:hypothetical protein
MYHGHRNLLDQVEDHFSLFRDSVNLDARLVHGFALNVPLVQKSFWAQPMVLLCDVGRVETRFGPFGDSVNLDATWIKKSFWTHLIVLLGDVDQAEAHFDLFGDSFNFRTRKVHGLCRMYHGHSNRFGHT